MPQGRAAGSMAAARPEGLQDAAYDPNEKRVQLTAIELMQKIWGEGFNTPLDKAEFLNMTVGLGLSPEKSALDLSAGLGGPARLLVEHYKTYVSCFERNADLVAEAEKQAAKKKPVAGSIAIKHYDPEKFSYRRRVDVVLFRELFYAIRDKSLFLRAVAECMKPGGELLITDFVCEAVDLDHPSISLWLKTESADTYIPSKALVLALLAQYGFEVRVSQDLTKNYLRNIRKGLQRLLTFMEGKKFSSATKVTLVNQVDQWTKRYSALHVGVSYMRFHAIRKVRNGL